MDQYAADLKSLLDSLNIKQAVIGGISMGGYIALAFYAQYADRVKGLILANTRAVPDSEEGRQARLANAHKVGQVGPGFLVDAMAPKMLGTAAKPEIEIAVRSMMAPSTYRGCHVGAARHGGSPRSHRPAPLCDVPVLIYLGHSR